jgi:predicted transcriptional regulator
MLPALDEIAMRRKLLGLTQKQLAKLAGVSQSLIAKLESGKIDSSYTNAKGILDALKQLEIKNQINVSSILHHDIVGVQKNETVAEAVRRMVDHGYSQLPVYDGEGVVGSISEKTILLQVKAGKDLNLISSSLVEEIMDEALPQVGEDTPVYLISNLLEVYSAVLVLKRGKSVGIVTKADLLKMVLK